MASAERDRVPLVLHTRVVTGSGGGPEKTILNSPRFLARSGYRSLCAYMRPPHDDGFAALEQRGQELAAEIVPLDDHGPADFQLLRKLLRLCREHRVDIWHAHDYKSNFFGLLLRKHWPMRLVSTVHGWVQRTWKTPVLYAFDRVSLPRYDFVICVSSDLHDRCRSLGVPEDRCQLIHNGIDTETCRRQISIAEAKRARGISPETTLIGAAGRLSPEKGFDRLIRSVHDLLAQGHQPRLQIVGEGDERPRLQQLIRELGCQDRIELLGFQADLAAFYQSLDLFALSSLREGLPNVLLEAMAYEVPVVATRTAGVPRLVRDGENGLLCPVGDVPALTDSIGRLLEQQELRRRFAAAGRRVIEHEFSFSDRMRTIAAVYDSLLQLPATVAAEAQQTAVPAAGRLA